RHAELEKRRVGARSVRLVDARWAPREHDGFRGHFAKLGYGQVERVDFAVDVAFANAPSDELGGLRPVLEDDDELVPLHSRGRTITNFGYSPALRSSPRQWRGLASTTTSFSSRRAPAAHARHPSSVGGALVLAGRGSRQRSTRRRRGSSEAST